MGFFVWNLVLDSSKNVRCIIVQVFLSTKSLVNVSEVHKKGPYNLPLAIARVHKNVECIVPNFKLWQNSLVYFTVVYKQVSPKSNSKHVIESCFLLVIGLKGKFSLFFLMTKPALMNFDGLKFRGWEIGVLVLFFIRFGRIYQYLCRSWSYEKAIRRFPKPMHSNYCIAWKWWKQKLMSVTLLKAWKWWRTGQL